MINFSFNPDKNLKIKAKYGYSFEQIICSNEYPYLEYLKKAEEYHQKYDLIPYMEFLFQRNKDKGVDCGKVRIFSGGAMRLVFIRLPERTSILKLLIFFP